MNKLIILSQIPDKIDDSNTLLFDINLLLPHSSTSLNIPEFVTYLPLMEQQFGNLKSGFYFENAVIGGFSSKVTVGVSSRL
jgi:hypothetical protein